MARSAESSEGAWGVTRTEPIHYRCPCGLLFAATVHRTVNATRDPAIAERLRAGSLGRIVCPDCGTASEVAVPVVHHDEAAGKLTLILPAALRHRELEERAALLLELARDPGPSLPPYAVDFAVAYGPSWPAEISAQVTAPTPDSAAGASDGGEVRAVIEDSTNRMALAQDRTRPPEKSEAVERWALSRAASAFDVTGGEVRLLLKIGERIPEAPLDVRVQLHRLPSYPVVLITVGVSGDDEPSAVFFDVERPEDRQALSLLGRAFQLVLEFYDDAYDLVARRDVELPLASNVRYALAVAEEQLGQLPAARRSFDGAVAAFRGAGEGRYGRRDPRLDADSFNHLPSAASVQQALGVVAGWSEPSNEDYLLFVRSFPVDWWRAIRGRVVARAVELGLVLPGTLLDVALAESAVRSRRELVTGLVAAFADLCAEPEANDLDPDQIAANWRALFILCEEEGAPVDARVADVARQTPGVRPPLIVVQPRRSVDDAATLPGELSGRMVRPASAGRAAYEETSRLAVSAVEDSRDRLDAAILAGLPELPALDDQPAGRSPPLRPDYQGATLSELFDLLDDADLRLGAAVELVGRGDPLAVGPVFGAVRRMTRGEAVRVLPAAVRFGDHAVAHFVDGLRSRKAYLRQGCALALGVLRSKDGLEPLCDLLLGEPTDVWKEVARALGDVGSAAILPLVARLGDAAESDPERRERAAWALAHIAAKGSRAAVENLAGGRDAVAAVAARRALELTGAARENDAQVRGRLGGEVTVNRAFSKKFFEGMNGPPRAEPATLDSGAYIMEDSGESGESSAAIDADAEVLEEEDILPG